MKILTETKLDDGRILQIVRAVFPEDNGIAPDWMLKLFQDDSPECWVQYYGDLFQNGNPDCRDYLYAGLVDGIPCSRMWFGYSQRTRAGNFGNVMTHSEYRRQGIMRRILAFCADDFFSSDALFCSCDAAKTAAPAYASVGFKRIFDETKSPMAIVQKDALPFPMIAEKAYADPAGAFVREGTLCDRFDCDKLLAYVPAVYETPARGADYLTCWRLVRLGEAKITVLEARSGFCAGYACRTGQGCTAVLHPAFAAYRDLL